MTASLIRRMADVPQQLDISLERWGSVTSALDDPEFTLEDADDIALMLSAAELVELNYVAAVVWEALERPHTAVELGAKVAARFVVETDVAVSDTKDLVMTLVALGLVTDAV